MWLRSHFHPFPWAFIFFSRGISQQPFLHMISGMLSPLINLRVVRRSRVYCLGIKLHTFSLLSINYHNMLSLKNLGIRIQHTWITYSCMFLLLTQDSISLSVSSFLTVLEPGKYKVKGWYLLKVFLLQRRVGHHMGRNSLNTEGRSKSKQTPESRPS